MSRLTKPEKIKLSHGEEVVICKHDEKDCNDSCMKIIPCKWYKKAMDRLKEYEDLGTVAELKEAKEKQIPQRPNIKGDGYADGHLVYDTWSCPNCDKAYEIDYDDYDYCPNCGQKIDWREEDD